ncbi:MAG: hypothetical protein AAB948_00300, partial [Patescibacteria group bacterium]
DHASVSSNFEITGGFASISGELNLKGGLEVAKGDAADVAYSRFGTAIAGNALITAANDLLISGDLELDGKAFFDGTASVASNFEVSGTASISAFNLPDKDGGLLGDCEATTEKLVYDLATKKFDCGIDQTGTGSAFSGIEIQEGSGTFIHATSISFDAGGFRLTNTTSQSFVYLDYTNGPASRAFDETITGKWNFNAASTQFDFIELTGTASVTTANTNFNINLGGTGDFVIQDAGTAIFTIADDNTITLNNEITDRTLINGLASVTSNFEVSGAASVSALTIAGNYAYRVGGTDVSLADGGTGASLVDPNVDRLFIWDDSAGATVLAGLGGFLTMTSTPTLTITSDSLGFDQFQDALSLDANTTITGGAFALTFDHASVSSNFEITGGFASISGELNLKGGLEVAKGDAADVAYSRFGTDTTTHTGSITASNDLLISGDL